MIVTSNVSDSVVSVGMDRVCITRFSTWLWHVVPWIVPIHFAGTMVFRAATITGCSQKKCTTSWILYQACPRCGSRVPIVWGILVQVDSSPKSITCPMMMTPISVLRFLYKISRYFKWTGRSLSKLVYALFALKLRIALILGQLTHGFHHSKAY